MKTSQRSVEVHSLTAAMLDQKTREKVLQEMGTYWGNRRVGDIAYFSMLALCPIVAIAPALGLESTTSVLTYLFALCGAIASLLASGYHDDLALESLDRIERELIQLSDLTHQYPGQSHYVEDMDNRAMYLRKHMVMVLQQLTQVE